MPILKQKVLKQFFLISLSISLGSILLSLLAQPILPPQIPLFYGLPEGEGQLAPALALALPGTFSFFILIVNLAVIKIIKDDFLRKILAVAAFTVSVFAIITTAKIIFLVGNI